jgi:putative transposase
MSMRPLQFAPDEWFHCFTRGVDKRQIFMDEHDAERFQMLLYTCNSAKPIHISNLFHEAQKSPTLSHVLAIPRDKPLVEIGSYCLMPNHPHFLLKETDYGGITAFMQKLLTAYSMYFNKKHARTGALFSGRFKAIHVATDSHFRRVVNYIHANPAELYEPGWKKGIIRNESLLKKKLMTYPYSSLLEYEDVRRPESVIVNMESTMEHLDRRPSFKALLDDARIFCRQERDLLSDIG